MRAPRLLAAHDRTLAGARFALTNGRRVGIVFKPCRSRGWFGDVAQLGERCLRTAEVAGSTPVVSTKHIDVGAQPQVAGAPRLFQQPMIGSTIAVTRR